MAETRITKRVYFAAALIIAAGGGIGFMLRPASARDAGQEDAATSSAPVYAKYSAPSANGLLPSALNVAAAGRPDCFYLRVAYNRSLAPGGRSDQTNQLRQQGADAGCWMGGD